MRKMIDLIDRWSFSFCAYCEDDKILVSIDGMLEYRCIKCGRTMKDKDYIEQASRIVSLYRDELEK